MKRVVLAAVTITTMLSAAPLLAQPASTRVSHADSVIHADRAIAERIAGKVRRYTNYTIFDDINIGVDHGIVTLSGRVTMEYKAKDIARIAARVQGVTEVNNEIETLPVSIYDDRLRSTLARQIYRDPVFDRYAIHVNPPIHIIVERGNVTLAGFVNSPLERQKAEFIARSTFGVFDVENRLQID